MGYISDVSIRFLTICWCCGVAHPSPIESLTVLHTNDLHMNFEEAGAEAKQCMQGAYCYGGIARLHTHIAAQLKKRTNTLLVDAGCVIDGWIMQTEMGKELVKDLLKPLKYDAMALGVSELSGTIDDVAEYVRIMDKPFVCTNIRFSNDTDSGRYLNEKCRRSWLKMYGGLKIAILSYVRRELEQKITSGNITLVDELEALQTEVKYLQTTYYIKAFVLLGTSSSYLDGDLMKHFNNTILIKGHSRALFHNGDAPNGVYPDFPYPVNMSTPNRSLLVAGAYFHVFFLGQLRLKFSREGYLLGHDSTNPIFLNGDKDSAVAKQLSKYSNFLVSTSGHGPNARGRIYGQSVFVIDGGTRCQQKECAMGNFITDAMVSWLVHETVLNHEQSMWSIASVAVLESWRIASSLVRGDITFRNIKATLRHDAQLELVVLNGSELYSLISDELRAFRSVKDRLLVATEDRLFLHVSGMIVNATRESEDAGYEVRWIKVLCSICLLPQYEPIDFNKDYMLVVTRWLMMEKNLTSYAGVAQNLSYTISNYILWNDPVVVYTGNRLLLLDSTDASPAPCSAPLCCRLLTLLQLIILASAVY